MSGGWTTSPTKTFYTASHTAIQVARQLIPQIIPSLVSLLTSQTTWSCVVWLTPKPANAAELNGLHPPGQFPTRTPCFFAPGTAIPAVIMVRGVAFVILGLVVSCAGFASPPTARRWLPNAGRGALKNTCRTHCMSIREMIGGDVESGGLFDPLGERDIYSLFRYRYVYVCR